MDSLFRPPVASRPGQGGGEARARAPRRPPPSVYPPSVLSPCVPHAATAGALAAGLDLVVVVGRVGRLTRRGSTRVGRATRVRGPADSDGRVRGPGARPTWRLARKGSLTAGPRPRRCRPLTGARTSASRVWGEGRAQLASGQYLLRAAVPRSAAAAAGGGEAGGRRPGGTGEDRGDRGARGGGGEAENGARAG